MNCHHNYPWYRDWHDQFAANGFLVIGVHTPETKAEFDIDNIRAAVKKAQFVFPVVVDNDKRIWNAWGNSMWPSVYLIDKKGYVRYAWYGELNWKGVEGEKIMRKHIEELLAE